MHYIFLTLKKINLCINNPVYVSCLQILHEDSPKGIFRWIGQKIILFIFLINRDWHIYISKSN